MSQPPDQPDQQAHIYDSPTDMSPVEERPNPLANQALLQNPARLKRKFETVEPAPPTPAIKKVTTFIDGNYGKDTEPKTFELKRFVDRATNRYSYDNCPLPEDHVRLLFLKPSEDRDAFIIVELQAFPIDELVAKPNDYRFTALSYNWGGGKKEKEIFVDMTPDSQPPAKMKGMGDLPTAWKRRMKPIWVKPNLIIRVPSISVRSLA